MSIEHKVKPSKKALEAAKQKRIHTLKLCGMCLGVLVILAGVFFLGRLSVDKNPVDPQSIVDAREKQVTTIQTTKLKKMKDINYTGAWFDGKRDMFHVFLPGEPQGDKKYASDALLIYTREDYDKTLYASYGVISGENRYHEDFLQDGTVFLDEFNLKLAVDAMLSTGGTKPNISWEFEPRVLEDGTHVLYAEGVFEASISYYDEQEVKGQGKEYSEVEQYRFQGYLYDVFDYPVFVYTLYKTEYYFAEHDVPYYIANILHTFFTTEFEDDGTGYAVSSVVDTTTVPSNYDDEVYDVIPPLDPMSGNGYDYGRSDGGMYLSPDGMEEAGDGNIPVDWGKMFYTDDSGNRVYIESRDELPEGKTVEYESRTIEVDFDKVTINDSTHVVRDSETDEILGWYDIETGLVFPIREDMLENIKS